MSVTKVTGMMQIGTKGGDIPFAGTMIIDTDDKAAIEKRRADVKAKYPKP